MRLPASFEHCPDCGRLNVRDALNPSGRCVCSSPLPQPDPNTLMGKLATVHACPDQWGNCAFGGVGCHA